MSDDNSKQQYQHVASFDEHTWQPQATSSFQMDHSDISTPIVCEDLSSILSSDISLPTVYVTATNTPHRSKEEIQNYLRQSFETVIQDLFNDDKLCYSYSRIVEWSIGDDPKLEYHLTIGIRQPTIVISI
ncbi:unnamed protein product [Adineta ricciae]|uniref:Uncharacterized protein n=1 Tax=Adineta ricciae TaxID=249248 RepID=A0A815SZF1_ADIRI|nr:unnamed protein product [Adineta ricciae]CAF1498480.1 unnamed protein product [Adineta ricciae]